MKKLFLALLFVGTLAAGPGCSGGSGDDPKLAKGAVVNGPTAPTLTQEGANAGVERPRAKRRG